MTDENVFPTTYEQWRECIEVRCKTPLTPAFIKKRLTELQDSQHVKTKEFGKLYGNAHLERTIAWFRRAADEVSGG